MSGITRKSQFTRFNAIDYGIVVLALCTPYIFDGLEVYLSGFIPVFKIGIIPKNVIALSVLYFRIAIARGQNPYSDNSISLIILALWSITWLLFWKKLDMYITTLLIKEYWFQVIYWTCFAVLDYFLLFELSFRKKQSVDAEEKKISLEDKILKEEIKDIDKKIIELQAKKEELAKQVGR